MQIKSIKVVTYSQVTYYYIYGRHVKKQKKKKNSTTSIQLIVEAAAGTLVKELTTSTTSNWSFRTGPGAGCPSVHTSLLAPSASLSS